MIGRLSGTLLEKQAPDLLIDVQGLGYEIQAPMSTFYCLPDIGEKVVLNTHFVVREDVQLLFGFYSLQERALFRALIKVNGVGPKLALAILSGIEIDEFVRTVHSGDSTALVRLPGVGKKTAERLVIEMRDKLKDWSVEMPVSKEGYSSRQAETSINRSPLSNSITDAESALVALGYKLQEASKAVSGVVDDSLKQTSEELIRLALRGMMAKSH